MADTTPVYDLPYLEGGDPPDIPVATEGLATAVEAELVRIDAAAATFNKIHTVTYSGTTDANGYLTVTHGAGGTPLGGWAVTTNPNSSFAQFWGIDTIGATTVRLRFSSTAANTALASAAVQGRLFVVKT